MGLDGDRLQIHRYAGLLNIALPNSNLLFSSILRDTKQIRDLHIRNNGHKGEIN